MSKPKPVSLGALLPDDFAALLESKGAAFIKRAGVGTVRQVVLDVLCGQNLRTSTELLTRARLGRMNAATFLIYLRGLQAASDFTRRLPAMAFTTLRSRSPRAERELSQWMIGLTGKGVQNVLRGDERHLKKYTEAFGANLQTLAAETGSACGELQCLVKATDGRSTTLDWHDLLSLFCTIGSQTLAIRGSEKSTYGKLFERLLLGSVLSILGFEQTGHPPSRTSGVFWLSSKIGEREADATLLVAPGQAVRFDLGFIGVGNPEITKDKVSRFERELEIGYQQHHSATCIIVDRIAPGSALEEHARRAGAKVIQMSLSYWPKDLARWLHEKFAWKSDLLRCADSALADRFMERLKAVNFENFVQGLSMADDEK